MLKRNSFFIVIVAILLLLVACSQTQPVQPNPTETTQHEETEGEHAVHWGYEGEGAPEHWADLHPDYAVCGTGVEQSPIDIPADAPVNADNLGYHYQDTAVTIVNNGHAIQVNYDAGSTVEIDGEPYKLLQFHFHGTSEHTLNGASTAMEMHLVHQNAEGGLAVIGVMIQEGAENAAYAPVWDNLPAEEGEPETIGGATVNVGDLLPADRSYYRYDGSLTTPPCSEGVKWRVLSHQVELSAAQIAAFTAIMERDNRPVQPMNDREFIVTEEAAEGGHDVHWGYEAEGAPQHWADLDPDYGLRGDLPSCGNGSI